MLVVLQLVLWLSSVVLLMVLGGDAPLRTRADRRTPASLVLSQLFDYAQLVSFVYPATHTSNLLALFTMRMPIIAGMCLYARTAYTALLETVSQPLVLGAELVLTYGAGCLVWILVKRSKLPVFALVQPLLLLAMASYTSVTLAVMEMWRCETISKWRVLVQSASLLCSGPLYEKHMAISIVAFLAYSALFPAALVVFLVKNRKRLQNLEFKRKYGVLYQEFTKGYEWWCVFKLLRRMVFCALAFIPGSFGIMRATAFAVLSAVLYGAHATVSPSASFLVHLTELFCLSSLVLVSIGDVAARVTATDPATASTRQKAFAQHPLC